MDGWEIRSVESRRESSSFLLQFEIPLAEVSFFAFLSIEIACIMAMFGAALQTSAMNISWMMFGRIITGLGTGALNAIVPVLSSELATHDARGAIIG